jgi:hypothetical protein
MVRKSNRKDLKDLKELFELFVVFGVFVVRFILSQGETPRISVELCEILCGRQNERLCG